MTAENGVGQRTRRVVVRCGAGAAGAGLLAACGAIGGPSTSPTGARRNVTLQFLSRFGGTNPIEAVEIKNLPLYTQKAAPTSVERSVIADYNTLLDKLTVGFASGTAPDVFTLGSPGIAQFAAPGHLLALDKSTQVRKESEDFFGPPLNVGKYKGTLFGLTYFVDMRIPLYRKDILADAGLPTDRKSQPKTWEQFRDVTRRLAQWEGGELRRIGFDVPKGDDTLFYTLVRQQGKDALNGDMTKAGFDPVEGERALQFEVDLLQRDRVDAYVRPTFPSGVEGLATPLLAARWTSSQVMAGMQRAGVSARDVLVTDFTPEYAGKTTATGYLGGTWVAVNKDSGAPDEAIDLLLYLSGLEHSLAVAEATLTTPSRKSADKSALVQDPTLRPFYDALATAWSVPQHQKFEFVRRKVVELQTAALKQEKSVKEAVAEMIAQTSVQLGSA